MTGWDLARVLAWVPDARQAGSGLGKRHGTREGRGTLVPLVVETSGLGRLDDFVAERVPFGTVPFEWADQGKAIAVTVTDAHPFDGRASARAMIPLQPGRPIEGEAELGGIDTAGLSASLSIEKLRLSGRAGGRVTFSVPADVSSLDVIARLASPELTFQGIPAERLQASLRTRDRSLGYEVTAQTLGGSLSMKGAMALDQPPLQREANGEARAVGFQLDQLWNTLGLPASVSQLSGRGGLRERPGRARRA